MNIVFLIIGIAVLSFFVFQLRYIYLGMIGKWAYKNDFKFDPDTKTLQIQSKTIKEEINIGQIQKIRWNYCNHDNDDPSSVLVNQSLQIFLMDGRIKKYRFDMNQPEIFFKSLESFGTLIEKNIVSNDVWPS